MVLISGFATQFLGETLASIGMTAQAFFSLFSASKHHIAILLRLMKKAYGIHPASGLAEIDLGLGWAELGRRF